MIQFWDKLTNFTYNKIETDKLIKTDKSKKKYKPKQSLQDGRAFNADGSYKHT